MKGEINMTAYTSFHEGSMSNYYNLTDEELHKGFEALPKIPGIQG
jgi:hypothetical protein